MKEKWEGFESPDGCLDTRLPQEPLKVYGDLHQIAGLKYECFDVVSAPDVPVGEEPLRGASASHPTLGKKKKIE